MKAKQLAENEGFECAIRRDGRIVGAVGFNAIEWLHRSTTIGYWLAAAEQGRGTMTAAVSALVDHAFAVMDLNRVEIRAAVQNPAAVRSPSASDSARRESPAKACGSGSATTTTSCTRCWPGTGPPRT